MSSFEYAAPKSIEEAVAILSGGSEARPLAGGQTMLVGRNRERLKGTVLVDLGRISSLSGIGRQDGAVRIGATATLNAIASSELLRKELPALSEAAAAIGDAQLRNRGTIGGNIAEGDPEYDLPAVLLALDASIELAGSNGRRKVSARDFFKERHPHSAESDELIVSILQPGAQPNSGMAYVRLKHPARLTPVCGVAAVLTVERGRVLRARIGLTGATDHPTRLETVESALLNGTVTDEQFSSVAAKSDGGISFRSDAFASADYRRHLTRVLTARALKQALSRINA